MKNRYYMIIALTILMIVSVGCSDSGTIDVLTLKGDGFRLVFKETTKHNIIAGNWFFNMNLYFVDEVSSKTKEIDKITTGLYKIPQKNENYIFLRKPVEKIMNRKVDNWRILINPELFSIEEYNKITDLIRTKLADIDKFAETPRAPAKKYYNMRSQRKPHIVSTRFLNKNDIEKKYIINENLYINLKADGELICVFKRDTGHHGLTTSFYYIGMAKNNNLYLNSRTIRQIPDYSENEFESILKKYRNGERTVYDDFKVEILYPENNIKNTFLMMVNNRD